MAGSALIRPAKCQQEQWSAAANAPRLLRGDWSLQTGDLQD
ncbi:hypothetical protein SynMITS9220_01115 [Synechococcus sp. MIT S9220]|nr:hypothetical protein SynMITS9220_01115 [Synechococcus sp. MIT S9220]